MAIANLIFSIHCNKIHFKGERLYMGIQVGEFRIQDDNSKASKTLTFTFNKRSVLFISDLVNQVCSTSQCL